MNLHQHCSWRRKWGKARSDQSWPVQRSPSGQATGEAQSLWQCPTKIMQFFTWGHLNSHLIPKNTGCTRSWHLFWAKPNGSQPGWNAKNEDLRRANNLKYQNWWKSQSFPYGLCDESQPESIWIQKKVKFDKIVVKPRDVDRIFNHAPRQLPKTPIRTEVRSPYLSRNQLQN